MLARASSGNKEMKRHLLLLSLFSALLIVAGCTTNSSRSIPPALVASDPSGVQPITGADPLPSWNEGPAKQAILNFGKTTTDKNNAKFVVPDDRIATFDQDGTTWVEHPMYSQWGQAAGYLPLSWKTSSRGIW
jgi:hypothetical protein